MALSFSLNAVPQEVLEQIAFFSATNRFLGPPVAVAPLLRTNKRIYESLSFENNPHLYAKIFENKFDVKTALSRLGANQFTPITLAHELRRRCIYLKRIRARKDSKKTAVVDSDESNIDILQELLFYVYVMMLENEGKNMQQLRDWARMDGWLRDFWFGSNGASNAVAVTHWDMWPANDLKSSVAMWLFWFFLNPDDYPSDGSSSWAALTTLRVYALAAHRYNLTTPSWLEFAPRLCHEIPTVVQYYGTSYKLTPPPLATPAILSFLTLVNKMSQGSECAIPLTPSNPTVVHKIDEWQCEWERCISLGNGTLDRILTDSFKPGSIEGVWEGLFTYTEFTAYAALLAGASPNILQKSVVVRHQQTWKLREHHLLVADASRSDSGIGLDMDNTEPLPAGDPLRSYFPTGTILKEDRDGIEVREGEKKPALRYQRASPGSTSCGVDSQDKGKSAVLDIIITGEGHSAWGQFNLVGRVRPCDGFISLSKEYIDGDRGKWLYRGYLVGNANGNFAGRWRDTMSEVNSAGYEGCFAMSRRR
ncbi:hypothetical protein BDQ12DRAFT_654308 [Crucibulum laeve]|uniref:F-box domain-containing protein n=1 Tax=Crucibulum laeve TaxID=68775 RepID=A0A5C3LWT3_9AGAR|nr:hypothetical protein BDQ12DRAFT_654308 [Crucibulum laeve]